MASNIALIKNNAKISAKIAIELRNLYLNEETANKKSDSNYSLNQNLSDKNAVFIGGINLDSTFKLLDEKTIHLKGVTQPCLASNSLGGVARNMAEALIRLGGKDSILLSALANDPASQYITEKSNQIGFNTTRWLFVNENNLATGSYNAIFDTKGELILGCGDMRCHDYISPEYIKQNIQAIEKAAICVFDADIPINTIQYISEFCEKKHIPLFFNATDLRKATKVVEANVLSKITFMSLNSKELLSIFEAVLKKDTLLSQNEFEFFNKICSKYKQNLEKIESLDLTHMLKYILKYVPVIFLSQGSKDVIVACSYNLNIDDLENQMPKRETLLAFRRKPSSPILINFPVLQLDDNEHFVNVSGAGDRYINLLIDIET